MKKSCSSCPSYKSWGKRFWSNGSSMSLYFDGKVSDAKTGNVSTRVNGWQYSMWMFICECIDYLVSFLPGRCQSYSLSPWTLIHVSVTKRGHAIIFYKRWYFTTFTSHIVALEKWKWKCVNFKCYSSEELITLNTLHEVVPTWYSFHSWVDWSNADKVSCSRRKHIDAGDWTVNVCIQGRHSNHYANCSLIVH